MTTQMAIGALCTSLTTLLFPEQCALCGLEACGPLCAVCQEDLRRIEPACETCAAPLPVAVRRCGQCQRRPPPWASASIPYVWEGAARRAVLNLKQSGSTTLIDALLDAAAPELPGTTGALCPMPTTFYRRWQRGFNPAESIAWALARRLGLSVNSDLLRRTAGPRQTGSNKAQRRANVRAVFYARGSAPATVTLVDDVVTTGASAEAATQALRRAGAGEVHLFALARATASVGRR